MTLTDFTPLTIPGCQMWLDATASNSMYQSGTRAAPGTLASSGTVIGLWLDQSGNNNDVFQATTNNKPTLLASCFTWPSTWSFNNETNGPLSAPKFAGQAISNTPQFLATTSNFFGAGFNQSLTMFVVAQDISISDSPAVMLADSTGTLYFNRGGNEVGGHASFGGVGGNIPANPPPYTGTGLGVDVFRYDGVNVDISHNGNRGRSAKTGNLGFTNGNIVIGNYNITSTGGYGYQGNIAEVLIYNVALTNMQIGQITSYLCNKWGILNSTGIVPMGSQVVALGNSLTFGYTGNSGSVGRWAGQDWPAQLSQYLSSNSKYFSIINTGSPGRATTWLLYYLPGVIGTYPYQGMVTKYDTSYANNIATVWEITNDLQQPAGTPPSGGVGHNPVAAFNNVVTYCQDLISYGYTVIVLTCLPRNPSDYSSTNSHFEQDRQDVNNAIRALWQSGGTAVVNGNTYSCTGGFAAALADVGGDTKIGMPASVVNNTTYYDSTLTHLTPAGHTIVANYVLSAMDSLLNFVGNQYTIILTGIGTNWSGSPFSIISGSGTILSQTVSSTTSATLSLYATALGPVSMTDGTHTFIVNSPNVTVNSPYNVPRIYNPKAVLSGNRKYFELATDDTSRFLYAIACDKGLTDYTPVGLYGASLTFTLRTGSTILLNGNTALLDPIPIGGMIYQFSASDISAIVSAMGSASSMLCRGAFSATFPSGLTIQFGGIDVRITIPSE